MSKLFHLLKAALQLGLPQSLAFLVYKLAKKSGYYRFFARSTSNQVPLVFESIRLHATPFAKKNLTANEQDQIEQLLAGVVKIFGAVVVPLDFSVPGELRHWTFHETPRLARKDIKFYWEPARFGWAVALAQAFCRTENQLLLRFLDDQLASFMASNPVNFGPHWANGQEVALRLIHLATAYSLAGAQPDGFAEVIAQHAARIPPTLIYARAQNNNHLISEAVGLYTAGVVLPNHPEALQWQTLGLKWFETAVLGQFEEDGTYMQQSTNYHRLVLTLAVWMQMLVTQSGSAFSSEVSDRLAAGTRWLLDCCDPATGRVPNLGPNDGAFLFPFLGHPFQDYRPVLQAASISFLGQPAFDQGPWDAFGAWLLPAIPQKAKSPFPEPGPQTGQIMHPVFESRAFIRSVHYKHRPGHADQLHVDLWWGGNNIAIDPGTYLYNAEPPWDNALQSAHHHNTLTVDGQDQMTRAGRFLYLDWAQSMMLERTSERITAAHNGYLALGVTHQRSLIASPTGWRIEDRLNGKPGASHSVCLHWLVPDWEWQISDGIFELQTPTGQIKLRVEAGDLIPHISVVRAGEVLRGQGHFPTRGWFSPTYGVKNPVVSVSFQVDSILPIRLESDWNLTGK